jgi:hypothetical protein
VEVLTLRGLVTYYVLFFIKLESRRVEVAGITPHPNEAWMKRIARNVTMDGWGFLKECRHLIHDRDTKFTGSFRAIIKRNGIIKVKTTYYYFESPRKQGIVVRDQSVVMNA